MGVNWRLLVGVACVSTASITVSGTAGASPGASARDVDASAEVVTVGFVGGKVRPDGTPIEQADRLIFEHFEAIGYDFTFVDDDRFLDPAFDPAVELAGYDLLMLSSGVQVHKVGDGLHDVPVPLVSWEGFLHDENGMAIVGGEIAPTTLIRINPGTPLSGSYSGPTRVTTVAERVSYGVVGGDAIVAATQAGRTRNAVLFGYTAGSTLADGGVAPAARVGFFLDWRSVRSATAATWDLFEIAVQFALT